MAGVLRDAASAAAGVGRERAGGGAPSARSLAVAGPDSAAQVNESRLLEWIPQLALGLCSARGAQLLKVAADGSATVAAAHGLPFRAEPEARQGAARFVIDLHPGAAGTRLMLVV